MQTEVSIMYLGDLCLTDNSLVQFVGLWHIYTGVKCRDVCCLFFFFVVLIASVE